MADTGDQKKADAISITGPVERINGELTLRIPLAAGGAALAPAVGRIGAVDETYLNIVIKPWLAEQLGVSEGSLVDVDNIDGKFNIRTVASLRLSMDVLNTQRMTPQESEHGEFPQRFAGALVTCLSPHIPAAFSLEARDGVLQVMHEGNRVGGTDVAWLLESFTPTPAHVASVALSAISDVQDAIAMELKTPWPAEGHRQPMPSTRVVERRLYLWYGDDRSPVVVCEPIVLDEIIGR
jgi:hypothetical protein